MRVVSGKKQVFNEYVNQNIQAEEISPAANPQKSWVIVKKGVDFCMMKTECIAYFFTENRIVYGVDGEGKKCIMDSNNLSELAEELNNRLFYKVNRKYIVNIHFIKKFRTFERIKIQVELTIQSSENIIISQESTKGFKNWIKSL